MKGEGKKGTQMKNPAALRAGFLQKTAEGDTKQGL